MSTPQQQPRDDKKTFGAQEPRFQTPDEHAFVLKSQRARCFAVCQAHLSWPMYRRLLKWSLLAIAILLPLKISIVFATCDRTIYPPKCGSADSIVSGLLNIPMTFLVAHVQVPYMTVTQFVPWLVRVLWKHLILAVVESTVMAILLALDRAWATVTWLVYLIWPYLKAAILIAIDVVRVIMTIPALCLTAATETCQLIWSTLASAALF